MAKKVRQKRISVTRQMAMPTESDLYLRAIVRVIWKLTQFLCIFFLGVTVTLCIVLGLVGVLYAEVLFRHAGMTTQQGIDVLKAAQRETIDSTAGRTNLLVLGTDVMSNRDADSILTDTILIASIGNETGGIKLLSYPRDLWIASQSAKINGLYQRDPVTARTLRSVVGDISGLEIHRILVIDMSDVVEIVNALGGLDIDIERSFVDYQFPRTDVDVRTVRDPKKLYEVVAFSEGREHMSGDRVMRYVRSRKSPDPMEGSDEGRVRRQQIVIAALMEKIQDPRLLREPETLGKLLRVYRTNFDTQMPIGELIALSRKLFESGADLKINSYQLPIQGVSNVPVLYHPDRFTGGAWVYLPIDPTWEQMRATVQQWLQE